MLKYFRGSCGEPQIIKHVELYTMHLLGLSDLGVVERWPANTITIIHRFHCDLHVRRLFLLVMLFRMKHCIRSF